MTFSLPLSSRSIAAALVLAGLHLAPVAAGEAQSIRALSGNVASAPNRNAATTVSRFALVIGNGDYPDADAPLVQSINDARALTKALRHNGFDVDLVEDARKDEMYRAVDRLRSRIKPNSVVMLFFGGYGIQIGRENYLIPVDPVIWMEYDVRRDGLSIESVLDMLNERRVRANLVVIDASRRNPYERRFRPFSRGLAPINAPDNTLILSSNMPDRVADDSTGQYSLLVAELLNNLETPAVSAETVFHNTSIAVSRVSGGQQIPSVFSSLSANVQLGTRADGFADPAQD